ATDHDVHRRWGVDRAEALLELEAEGQRPGVEVGELDVLPQQQPEQLLRAPDRRGGGAGGGGRRGRGPPRGARHRPPGGGGARGWTASSAPGGCAIRHCAVAGFASVVSALSLTRSNDPMSTQNACPDGQFASRLASRSRMFLSTFRNGSRSGPFAMVLNACASEAIVTSSPPTARDRSLSTGNGAWIVSRIGWTGLDRSPRCLTIFPLGPVGPPADGP